MENYRTIIKRRIVIYSVCIVCSLVFVVCAALWGYSLSQGSDQHASDFTNGFPVGVFSAFIAIMLMTILRYRKALRDEAALKALYVREHDERERMISVKIGGAGYNIVFGTVLLGAITAGFFDTAIGLTLMGVTLLMALVKLSLKIYYYKKY